MTEVLQGGFMIVYYLGSCVLAGVVGFAILQYTGLVDFGDEDELRKPTPLP